MDEQDQIQRALNRAFFFLRFRPRSEKEVIDYLKKKGEKYSWNDSIISAVLTRLKEIKAVDDVNFVDWFVHQRNSGKPKSRFGLTYELQRFGIDKDIISAYFDENPVEEESLALEALRRRWRSFQFLDKKIRFQKAAAFLSRRGFAFDTIKRSIESLENS